MPSTATPPPILSPEELYDSIMSTIEPELMTANQELVDALIAEDTPEERKERAERYEKAFLRFEEEFKKEQQAWEHAHQQYKKTMFQTLQEISTAKDRGGLSLLTDKIQAI